jgi:SWI/SNF-related matrix-associated actin-dependent regulator 1 of chromatin subfamily A
MPKELESQLLPFQREGVRFALKRGGRVLIADEMGLGKTLQAIAVVSCLETEWPVLIVVPSSLRLQWAAVSFTFPLYHSPWVFKCLCFAEV